MKCPVCGKHEFGVDDDYYFCPDWGGANDLSVNQAREAYKAGKKVY